MKVLKYLFHFVLLTLLNIFLKWKGYELLNFNKLSTYEFKEQLYIFFYVILYFGIFYFGLFIMLKLIKKTKAQYYFNKIKQNGIKSFIWISIVTILLMSDYIYLFYSVGYYYIFKKLLYKVWLIKDFYLDYASVKKYTLVYLILESPLILYILYLLISKEYSDCSEAFIIYMFISTFLFYLPIFICSWWDNRNLYLK